MYSVIYKSGHGPTAKAASIGEQKIVCLIATLEGAIKSDQELISPFARCPNSILPMYSSSVNFRLRNPASAVRVPQAFAKPQDVIAVLSAVVLHTASLLNRSGIKKINK
jgi:hypothetical protein